MNHRRTFTLLAALLALVALAGCNGVQVVEVTRPVAEFTLTPEPPTEPTAEATATPAPTAAPVEPTAESSSDLPPSVFYDLGEATLIQDNFPEESRFRNMPAQLNGVMAVPAGEGPYPVVLILHGTHPGCPVDDAGVDRWPCDPEVEQRNYAGFEYLVRELAARGYVALAPNINAENTFGFGEPTPGVRLWQLLEQQLSALATAAGGGDNGFGVELNGVADVRQLALIGHSRGGEMANYLTRKYGLDIPSGAGAERGFGPVAGLLLVAPARILQDSGGSNVPLAVIMPACDGDVVGQDGQTFYEDVRFEGNDFWSTTVLLAGANHNGFNTILGGDMIAHTGRPGCQPPLAPEAQRQFLVDYAADFLIALFGQEDAIAAAESRLGLDLMQPAPAELYGQPARLNVLPALADRMPLFGPQDEGELTAHQQAGPVVAEGATLFFCPAGYRVEAELAACRRPNFISPANPAMAVVSWTGPAEVRLEIPDGQWEVSSHTALTLRAAVDPLSELNAVDEPQSFSVRLTDAHGATATVVIGPDEPALQYMTGEFREDEMFPPGLLDAIVHMTTVRVPLVSFAGVDLSDVDEVALVFDQTASGTLFVADVEVAR